MAKIKVTVRAEDLLKLMDECDQYMLWSKPGWKIRKRLLDKALASLQEVQDQDQEQDQ